MKRLPRIALALLALPLLLAWPTRAQANCPGNLLINPSFEDGLYKGETVGTSLSSWLSLHWLPWAILGDQQINREIEFFVVDSQILREGTYRVHHGRYSQKFFSGFSTHDAGLYQRVPVTPGSRVTFSIWVQIATGQEEFWNGILPLSDLNAPGNYRVWAGIDPYGDMMPFFGAPPSPNTVWSSPVIDRETRMQDQNGNPIDGWVQLTVSTIARSNYVTVITRGQPEFPVKNNSSFWDNACLAMAAAPSPTPPPATPTIAPPATPTPAATATPTPSPTPPPTATPVPSPTPAPTNTPTATALPTATTQPTAPPPTATPQPAAPAQPPAASPTPAATAASPSPGGGGWGPYLIAGAIAAAVGGAAALYRRRRANSGG